MNLLTCQNAAFGYEGKIVVSQLNFTVQNGDYLCIVGENGTGKSTLIKGLLQFIPVLDGSVQNGTLLTGEPLQPKYIGYLPQQTQVQKDFPASVHEVVISGCLNQLGIRPFYSKKHKQKALSYLEKLGIAHLQKSCYRSLSGGQQQRVLLARALCAAKNLILLDEPAAGLDPLVTAELYSLIKKINTDYQMTVIMVTHDIQNTIRYASHVLHVQNQQLFFGTSAEYLQSKPGKLFLGNRHDNDI